jgi:hypothetical protein
MTSNWPTFFLLLAVTGFAAPSARTEDSVQNTLTAADQRNHLDLLKRMSMSQVRAVSGAYPDFRILELCSGRFSGVPTDELVLGIWKPQDSEDRWKREVHRVGLIRSSNEWEVHVIDDEIEKDEDKSQSYPMKWQYTLDANGFSGEVKCGIDPEFKGDSDLTYALGGRPFFDLKEEGLLGNEPVCFATDDVYNNWDCVVYSPRDRRFRLWFQQARAD